ncbi:hypothetical protein U3516DRAFT_743766 [Neocallimastix sp. 'constans']
MIYNSEHEYGTAAINVWEVLTRNNQFHLQRKLNVSNVIITLINQNGEKNYSIYSAWDGTGLSMDEDDLLTEMVQNQLLNSRIVNKTGAEKTPLNLYQRWNKYISDVFTFIESKNPTMDIININNKNSFYDISIPLESLNYKFKSTLFGLFSNGINNNNKVTQYAEFKTTLTFRNLKGASSFVPVEVDGKLRNNESEIEAQDNMEDK